MIRDLVMRARTYRRFCQDALDESTLRDLVDLARLSASAANRQPLKYMIACTADVNARIFPHLAWAGYLRDWDGPDENERPTGYIIVLGDTEISADFGIDCGIAVQNVLLGACEKGLGTCIVGAIRREALRQVLRIPDRFEILLVIAVGKPMETVVLESVREDGNIEYWRDDEGAHHVPKRSLDEVLIG